MIRLEYHSLLLDQGELQSYKMVYETVFGKWDAEGNCPSGVYYGYDKDTLIGLVAGYPMSSTLWYIQRIGYTHDEQHKTKNLRRTQEVMEQLHRDWPFLLTLIRNDDIPMLKTSLAVGFRIIGTRIDTQKDLWVEMMHGGN